MQAVASSRFPHLSFLFTSAKLLLARHGLKGHAQIRSARTAQPSVKQFLLNLLAEMLGIGLELPAIL